MNQEMTKERHREMTEQPVNRLIIRMALPTMFSMLLSSFYNLADTFFVSRINTSASAASGVAFPLLVIIQAVSLALAMGGGSYAARCLGAGELEEANKTVSTSFFLSVMVGSVIGFFIIIFLNQILCFLGATETILPFAWNYAFYIILATPFYSATFVLTTVIRQEGSPNIAMFGAAFGAVLNVILDPLFIFTFHGGVKGAAIATSLSQIVTFCILMKFVLSGRTITKIGWNYFSPEKKILREVIQIGLPELFRQLLACLATILLNVAASAYGDAALAAISIGNRIIQFIASLLMGFGQGFMPVCGYNYGAGNRKRVMQSFRFVLITGVSALTFCMIGILMFSSDLMKIFRAEDLEVVKIGSEMLRYQACLLPMAAFVILANMFYQACGEGGKATAISLARQGFFFIPLILILPSFLGLQGILISQPAADFMTGVLCVLLTVSCMRKVRMELS